MAYAPAAERGVTNAVVVGPARPDDDGISPALSDATVVCEPCHASSNACASSWRSSREPTKSRTTFASNCEPCGMRSSMTGLLIDGSLQALRGQSVTANAILRHTVGEGARGGSAYPATHPCLQYRWRSAVTLVSQLA